MNSSVSEISDTVNLDNFRIPSCAVMGDYIEYVVGAGGMI